MVLLRFREIAVQSGFDPSKLTAEGIFNTLHRLMLEEEAQQVD